MNPLSLEPQIFEEATQLSNKQLSARLCQDSRRSSRDCGGGRCTVGCRDFGLGNFEAFMQNLEKHTVLSLLFFMLMFYLVYALQ